jgi:transcriptional regulator with XRE-family HTH domain
MRGHSRRVDFPVGGLPVARFSGQRLRALREAKGMRRERLAVTLDRSFSSIIKWERNELAPSAADIGKLCEALGCGVGDLFDSTPTGAVA